jgi:hypothetical protein
VVESNCPSYPKIETLFNRGPDHFVTDDLRCPEFNQIAHWLVTEKIDGTNIRVSLESIDPLDGFAPWQVRFYGRTDAAQIPTFLLGYLQDTFTLDKMVALCMADAELYSITLYGEGYGARIQKGGGNYREGVSFRLFDVLVDGKWWLDWENVCDVAVKLGIFTVPRLASEFEADLDFIVAAVRGGFTSQVARWERGIDVPAEGVVARTDPYLFDKRGHPLRFKLKTRDFKENGNG